MYDEDPRVQVRNYDITGAAKKSCTKHMGKSLLINGDLKFT